MTLGSTILGVSFVALAVALTPLPARAQSDPAGLTALAVHINRTPKQSWPGYGIYLGNGLILTAAHVAGEFAQTKPHVLIAGQDLPAALVKEGSSRHHRSDALVDRRNKAASQSADAPYAAV